MPNITIIRSAIAELPKGPPLVAAFAGGSTGIGSYVVKALATAFAKDGSKLRVYIVARNASRSEALISECQRISPGSEWRFVAATDLALISEVDKCCQEIIRQETEAPFHGAPVRLDLLYMSHSVNILKKPTGKPSNVFAVYRGIGRRCECLYFAAVTKEGLDALMSTLYYSRIRFIQQLMPLLTASPLPGHVISIYAGGMEDGTKPGEMPIDCPPASSYGISSVRKHTCFMKNFMFEEFADKHAGRVSFTHIYPGLVDGPAFTSDETPRWFRIVWQVLKPIAWFYMTAPEVCGEVMTYLATPRCPPKGTVDDPSKKLIGGVDVATSTKGEVGGGSYALGQRADEWTKNVSYNKVRKEGLSEQIWEHTMGALERIEKENAKNT